MHPIVKKLFFVRSVSADWDRNLIGGLVVVDALRGKREKKIQYHTNLESGRSNKGMKSNRQWAVRKATNSDNTA